MQIPASATLTPNDICVVPVALELDVDGALLVAKLLRAEAIRQRGRGMTGDQPASLAAFVARTVDAAVQQELARDGAADA